jgi:dTDP-4-amino-4,6-dideoxygalactose transaminase
MAIARQRIHLPPGGWRRAISGLITGTLWEGNAVARLERAFADFIGVPEAVAVPSGRAGLSFIFSALGLEPGAEVICSAFGYPVVPHLAKSLGFDLRLVDCELDTLGMDPAALSAAISDRTRVVIATHLYGVPCQIREIAEIAEAHGAILIEDCAHCFGATVDGRRAGAWGSFGYFSFETSKPINTMGGGMVTIADPDVARRVREVARSEPDKNLSWLAKRLFKTTFEATVTNPLVFNLGVYPALRLLEGRGDEGERFASGYQRDEVTMRGRLGRFTNYQASLGLQQMNTSRGLLDRRVAHARRLMERLGDTVHFQRNDRPDVDSNYMLVTALFPEMRRVARELLQRGVDTKHHYMRDCSGLLDGEIGFPNAERAESEVLHLPAYPELSDAQIDRVADAVQQALATADAEAR